MFEFKRLVHMLLHIVSTSDHEGFVQRIGIYLLNSVACQVNNKQKNELGDAGAIKVLIIHCFNLMFRILIFFFFFVENDGNNQR